MKNNYELPTLDQARIGFERMASAMGKVSRPQLKPLKINLLMAGGTIKNPPRSAWWKRS